MIKKGKSLSVLFIGNSFSYYHALPTLLAHFARETNQAEISVDGVFMGGATLKMLWDEGTARKKLRSKKWDYVVLQERGRLGGIIRNGIVHAGKPQNFITYASRFDKEIKRAGAKTILYAPPAFIGRGAFEDAKKMEDAYAKLARKLHAILIPSVTAFLSALKRNPSLNLFETDGHHQNPFGTYLVAALFYRKIFRTATKNFPLRSFSSRIQHVIKKPQIVNLSRADAHFLWSVADRAKR